MKKLFKFSNLIIVLVVVMNVWFTKEVLDAFIKVGNEPSVLVGAWFSFTTTEVWALHRIKVHKIKKEMLKEVKSNDSNCS